METPPEEGNPVLIAFKKIATQLEKLDERERRAEERERNSLEREQKLIERQSKLNEEMNNLVLKSGNFQRSIVDIETRTQRYLDDYFKVLPKKTIVVQEKRWSIESNTKVILFIMLLLVLTSSLFVYFSTPQIDIIRLEYQSQRIEQLEAKLDYMIKKNPKTAKNYEAEKDK